jgi:hypothetical protein
VEKRTTCQSNVKRNAYSRVAVTFRGGYEEEWPRAVVPGTENESQEEGPSAGRLCLGFAFRTPEAQKKRLVQKKTWTRGSHSGISPAFLCSAQERGPPSLFSFLRLCHPGASAFLAGLASRAPYWAPRYPAPVRHIAHRSP